MTENRIWIKWTVLESLARSASKLIQKIVGKAATGFIFTAYASLIVGVVQVVASIIVLRWQKVSIFTEKFLIIGSIGFGFFATINTILPFYIFHIGGDIGVNTFIITLSVIPGAILDWLIFGQKINKRQFIGICVAVIAGYFILGSPNLKDIIHFKLWVWLSFLMSLSVAINQIITRSIKKVKAFQKNFWGGLTTLIFSLIVISVVPNGYFSLVSDTTTLYKVTWVTIPIGVFVICLWSFNLFSYADGAHVIIKKIVMNGSYLSIVTIGGIIFFHEPAYFGKLLGVVLYIVSFSIYDQEIWAYLNKILKKRR